VQVGRLILQRKNRRILVEEQDLALPAREFEVLWELMSPPGRSEERRVGKDVCSSDVVQVGRLILQRKNRRILVEEQDLALPAREFEVLWELMSPPGRTVSKRELSDKLSTFDDALADNALEAFISRLRKKLSDSGATIRTLRGIGYLLEEAKHTA